MQLDDSDNVRKHFDVQRSFRNKIVQEDERLFQKLFVCQGQLFNQKQYFPARLLSERLKSISSYLLISFQLSDVPAQS